MSANYPEEEIVRMIIGRSITSTFPPRERHVRKSPSARLAARNVSVAGRLKDACFDIAPGEILGVSGLQGMGQLELFLGCFGADAVERRPHRGQRQAVTLMSPRDAVRANIGISLIPEDRKTEGLFLKLDGRRTFPCRCWTVSPTSA